jgi:hypothetical protein
MAFRMIPKIPTRTDAYVACTCGGTMCISEAELIADKPMRMSHTYKCLACGKEATFEVEKKSTRVA